MAEFATVLKDLAGKIGKALGEDASKAEKRLMHDTGGNLEKNVQAHVEHDEKAAQNLRRAAGDDHTVPTTHGGGSGTPRAGSGSGPSTSATRPPRGGSDPAHTSTGAGPSATGAKRPRGDDSDSDANPRPPKSARGSAGSNAGSEVAGQARRYAARNDSGLPVNASTADQRRAYDKAHGSEPDWGKLTESYNGPKPADMVRPHGHHIVFKNGSAATQHAVNESKGILERNGIDWYTGPDNLIWAPNRGHSVANAEAVRDALRAADGQGPDAVRAALRNAGRTVFDGKP